MKITLEHVLHSDTADELINELLAVMRASPWTPEWLTLRLASALFTDDRLDLGLKSSSTKAKNAIERFRAMLESWEHQLYVSSSQG